MLGAKSSNLLPHFVGVTQELAALSASIDPLQPYSEPSVGEYSRFNATLQRDSAGHLVYYGLDDVTGRPCMFLPNIPPDNRGLYVRDLGARLSYLIQAPHPVYDLNTEFMAAAVWRGLPGAMLMVAGAHRQAGGEGNHQGLADVPWNTASLFNRVSAAFVPIPQIQIHGFNNATAPDYDIVAATGSADPGVLAIALADALQAAGFRVARVWEGFDVLTALGNKQSLNAAAAGSQFVHLETSYSLRIDRARRDLFVDTLVRVLS